MNTYADLSLRKRKYNVYNNSKIKNAKKIGIKIVTKRVRYFL